MPRKYRGRKRESLVKENEAKRSAKPCKRGRLEWNEVVRRNEEGEYRQVSSWQITRRGEIDVKRTRDNLKPFCRLSILLDKAIAAPPIYPRRY